MQATDTEEPGKLFDAGEPTLSLRWGASLGAGPVLGGGVGAAGEVQARIGGQLSREIALYAQPTLVAGGRASGTQSAMSGTALAFLGVGLLGEYMFSNQLYIAFGPSLFVGGLADTDFIMHDESASGRARVGTYVGATARGGLVLAETSDFALTLGLDLQAIFSPDGAIVTPMLGIGVDGSLFAMSRVR